MPKFLIDKFTNTAATALASHVASSLATWTKQEGGGGFVTDRGLDLLIGDWIN